MGKGDKKTRRGKIINKTFGVRRARPKKKFKANAQKQAD
ncbi:MAG: 30S ribosomal protein THX [Flavobacteriaceae bacterium]|nr:30S ribosomal protein THX [Flavobacteriaceae bacterium]